MNGSFIVNNSSVVIQSTIKKSDLSKALQSRDIEGAQEIIKQTYSMGRQISLAEHWQIKVFQNSDFSDEEFLSLSPETKSLVYRTANHFNKVALVGRLHFLGMTPPEYPIESLDLIHQYMDSALVSKTIIDFLINLRREGRLLTQEEFDNELDNSYIKKRDFTRILGHDRIKNLTEKLQLKHIKVPEKIAVLESEDELCVKVQAVTGEITIAGHEISIYAQNINQDKRFISREEILELFSIIEASNFIDLCPENFLIAADGIYFIDTEFRSFSGTIDWKKMKRLECYIEKEDREWFFELIQDRIKTQKNEPSLKPQNLGEIYQRYLSVKYTGMKFERLTDFVVKHKEHIKIAKAVGLFSVNRSFNFPIRDIL
jgi:hypothetical protein